LGLGNIFGGTLDFVEWHEQPHLCYQVRSFYPSINQSPTSGQINQGSLFEPRSTSLPWKKNHKKYFKDLVDRGRLKENRFYHFNSMQKLTKNPVLVGPFLSWDGSELRLLYTLRFICCFCFGVYFCKHMPFVLVFWYVVCGTIPSTCLKWNSMDIFIFVINKDLFFFYSCQHANIKGKNQESLFVYAKKYLSTSLSENFPK
jgi:hypothetical protein